MDKEKMININTSLVEEPVFNSFEKDGEEIKVANFYKKRQKFSFFNINTKNFKKKYFFSINTKNF